MKIVPLFASGFLILALTGCARFSIYDSARQRSFAKFFTAGKPPVIKIQKEPEDQLVLKGSNAVFSVKATPSDVTYQWRFNGTDIPGATSSNLTVVAADSLQVGKYTCELATLLQTVVTQPAYLSVYSLSLTNSGSTITVESGDYSGTPSAGGYCPYPYVARVRFPAGIGTFSKNALGPYTAFEPSGAAHKIMWQGNVFLNRGCATNGPVTIPTGTSSKFFFTVYYITTPTPPYQLQLTGFN